MTFEFQRAPAKIKKSSEINPAEDIRVRILGRVVSKAENTIIIDDGSQQTEIIIEPDFVKCLKEGETIRVFARVIPTERGFELRSEAIQDMNKLDIELYKKVFYKNDANN